MKNKDKSLNMRRAWLVTHLLFAGFSCLSTMFVGGCAVDASHDVGEFEQSDVGAPTDEPAGAIEKTGAGNSCQKWLTTGAGPLGGPNSVQALCTKANGNYVFSEAWLPGCMGNNDGRLVWGGRYFDRSCKGCKLERFPVEARAWFTCQCARTDGSWLQSSIEISYYLTNRNGQLTCE